MVGRYEENATIVLVERYDLPVREVKPAWTEIFHVNQVRGDKF
jgi:hypothetical protein